MCKTYIEFLLVYIISKLNMQVITKYKFIHPIHRWLTKMYMCDAPGSAKGVEISLVLQTCVKLMALWLQRAAWSTKKSRWPLLIFIVVFENALGP